MSAWLLLAASYLLGAVPSSFIAGKLFRGVDLRRHGSGNLGATNAFRVLGARIAAPVMAFDMLKGFVPAYLFPLWVAGTGATGEGGWGWAIAFGAAAIVGHVYPVYLAFRGGKGVATAAGVFLALAPVAVGVGLLVWLVTLAVARMVSLASILAAVALMIVLPFSGAPPAVQGLGFAVAAFVIFAHRANLRRILRGEEFRFGSRAARAEEE
jgi:acyl phosphate:glycerol-3-phosphate acyltransferase